ncbi:MAG TPA: porin [Pseudomonas sabulinigri]|uniref:Porin domain-containing protein n=1 Tax=marine sediment metagenome TaxID=412755 RepID=A0A0F9XQD8_9ZZZZ|nr:porin [Halopseudomonas sabulinigri]HEC53387.1 porin [Halopseudomonas sabulinigri]|tara:strand:- start:3938 stop:4999 length:1062 start_codon:yes stop_codon:yes gene_type:complete
MTLRKHFAGFAVTALAAAIPAVAMADVNIYGRAHVSVDFLDDGADYSETNLSSNSSRLGFKGDHEINPNLTAFFQIEQQINFSSGSSDGDSTNFATRDTFVGLKGGFGTFQLGRFDSPFKAARGPANLFGDQVGDMRNLTRVGNARFDERYDNTVQYTTPDMSGFFATLGYSVQEGEEADTDLDESVFSGSVNYVGDLLEASLAYETAEEDTGRGERDGFRGAAAFKITDAIKAVGFYQTVDYTNEAVTEAVRDQLTSDTYGLGAEFKVASNTAIKGMWMTRDADAEDYDSDMWVVGVEHKLDKAVRVYANYAIVDNEDNVALTPWGQARSATPGGAAGEEASGLSVGMRYDF